MQNENAEDHVSTKISSWNIFGALQLNDIANQKWQIRQVWFFTYNVFPVGIATCFQLMRASEDAATIPR